VLRGTAILMLSPILQFLEWQRSIPGVIYLLLTSRRAKMKTQRSDYAAHCQCPKAANDSHLVVRKHA